MYPYSRIAEALEAVSREVSNKEKAGIVAEILKGRPPEMLRPTVRLLTGQLWPSWEPRGMGVGPVTLREVLAELYSGFKDQISSQEDLGSLAQAISSHPSQNLLCPASLESLHVYQTLRRISAQKGAGSQHRKKALLRGLLLNATPLEAKYIVRTVLGRTTAGLGPYLMTSAISEAFEIDEALIREAYARLPEMGLVTLIASRDEILEVETAPPTPVRPMISGRRARLEDAIRRGSEAAYVVIYGGLRVQVHKVNGQAYFYTSRLRDVAWSLQDMAEDVAGLRGDLVVEGELVLVQSGRPLPTSEVVRYINRRSRPRGSDSRPKPSLMITDLLYQDGKDVTRLEYSERRRRLSRVIRRIAGKELREGVSLAEEQILEDPQKVEDFYRETLARGFWGLTVRDLEAPYRPGASSRTDFTIRR